MTKARDIADLGAVTSRLDTVGASDGALSNRNLIINGAMQVAQRGTSFTGVGASDAFTLDRYKFDFGSTSGRLTAEQSTDAPSGFGHSLKLSCTTADTSLSAGEKARIMYSFEGQDLPSLCKGTSDAKVVTASFYVKGNAAATYVCEFYDTDNNRQCSKLFNVTTSWTRIELTFPADTTGAFTYDNNTSVQFSFWLMAGSNYQSGTLNSSSFAATVTGDRVVGCDNFFDSTSRTFQITGVQLEVGDTATPFEHRSYGDELARCQRYFQRYEPLQLKGTMATGTNFGRNGAMLPVEMRATPSLTLTSIGTTGHNEIYDGLSTYVFSGTINANYSNNKKVELDGTVTTSTTGGRPAVWFSNAAAKTRFDLSAEL
jgi:hypothetical protein